MRNNWAVCDSLNPKIFARNMEKLLPIIDGWLNSGKTYTVRFSIVMLMKYRLGDGFNEALKKVSAVSSNDYYVKMAVAWFFAEALVKHYEGAIIYLKEKKLDVWTHNKAIQKAIESYRLDSGQKEYLNSLRIK